MVNYWKDKLLPNIKKAFQKNGTKKAAAAEATKIFDDSKEQYSKEFEEKKTELQPKVLEIYGDLSAEIKALIKEPKDVGLKKQSAAVQKFLDELAKIEFPGAKAVSEASSKFGPAYVAGPISFIFEKVSSFIPVDEKKEEAAAPEPAATETAPVSEATEVTEKDIVTEEKKEEAAAEAAVEKAEAPAEAAPEAPKAEEAPPAAAEPPKA